MPCLYNILFLFTFYILHAHYTAYTFIPALFTIYAATTIYTFYFTTLLLPHALFIFLSLFLLALFARCARRAAAPARAAPRRRCAACCAACMMLPPPRPKRMPCINRCCRASLACLLPCPAYAYLHYLTHHHAACHCTTACLSASQTLPFHHHRLHYYRCRARTTAPLRALRPTYCHCAFAHSPCLSLGGGGATMHSLRACLPTCRCSAAPHTAARNDVFFAICCCGVSFVFASTHLSLLLHVLHLLLCTHFLHFIF